MAALINWQGRDIAPIPTQRPKIRYVYVAGGGSIDLSLDLAITKQTGFALYSLIHGLKQADFGLHTIEGVTCDIREFTTLFVKPVAGRTYVDSGGYSFIVGTISPAQLDMLVDCYEVYLESEAGEFDFIFSLDIPFSLQYDAFNTVQNVYEANKASLTATRELLDGNPLLQKMFYLVWHFKIAEQYLIWQHLYEELELRRFVTNHAIGGMVGLKGATGIRYTPFTGMSFHLLNSYLESDFVGEELRIHFLGVYAQYDRFHIAFLRALFQRYLDGTAEVAMSYDSINPVHTARMNAQVPLYHFVGDNLEIYPSLIDAPDDVLRGIAVDESHVQHLLQEMERRRNGLRLEDSGSFSPLNVFSNIQLDIFFEKIIEQYDFTGELTQSCSPTNLQGRLHRIFDDIEQKYPNAFSRQMIRSILMTLDRTWRWHRWFVGRRDRSTLDRQMLEDIKDIGFPATLN